VLRRACEEYQATGTYDFIYDRQAGEYRPMTSADEYNYQENTYLLTPARRLQLFTAGNYALGKDVRVFYEASFVNRVSNRRFPAFPEGLVVDAGNVYNDFGTTLYVGKRLVEAGLRRSQEEVNTYRLALGLEGEVGAWAGPLQGWRWEVSYVVGRSAFRDRSDGGLRRAPVEASVGPSYRDDEGVARCGTPDAPIPGCVPFDATHGAQAFTAEQQRLFTFSGVTHGEMEQHVFSAGASGRLVDLWANRPAGLAAGVELHRESGGYFPDPVSAAGEAMEGNQPAVSGGYSSREAYAELSLPLVSQRPLVEDLELVAALRRVDYSSFGANTTYELGGRWMPVRDVTLRGTWSTAFRAPGILELYTGTAESFRGGEDPCLDPPTPAVAQQCERELAGREPIDDGSGELRTLEGGNTQLRPERATIFTAGVVVEPRWLRRLSLTADYWDIRLERTIEILGAGTILDYCYTGDGSGAEYCGRIHRDAASGNITHIDDRYTNVGRTRTSGLDLAARYALPTPTAGAFRFALDATYLHRYERSLPGGYEVDAAGNYDLALLLPRWKWNAGVGWQYGPFGLATDARYIGAFKECGNSAGESSGGRCASNPQYSRTVRANLVFDLAASYERKSALGTTGVAAGVRNVLDSAPPKIFSAGYNNTDPGYDFTGRYVWARVTQAF
jgi:outer membrane receptor protein involved in Fe transport